MVAAMLNEKEERSNQSVIEVGTRCCLVLRFSLLCLLEVCERRQNKAAAAATTITTKNGRRTPDWSSKSSAFLPECCRSKFMFNINL